MKYIMMDVVNLNKMMETTTLDPNRINMFLVGKGDEMRRKLKLIERIHQMMINSEGNSHIKWLLYCEMWCLVTDK